MPHLTLEHTANLQPAVEPNALMQRLHDVLSDVGGIAKGNCKTRLVELSRFHVGDGAMPAGFVHLDVRFLEGRAPEVKQEIGRRLLAILKQGFPAPAGVADLQVTVEIRDIERATYFKSPEGSLGAHP